LVDDAFVIFHRRALCDDQRYHAGASDRQPIHLEGTFKYSDLGASLLDYRIIFSDDLGGKLRLSCAEAGQFRFTAFRHYVAGHHRSERIDVDAARGLDGQIEFVRTNPGAGKNAR
jgi:hypothetical protein